MTRGSSAGESPSRYDWVPCSTFVTLPLGGVEIQNMIQIVRMATTNLDRHGHRFTREDLDHLVAQAGGPEFIYAEHDTSNPPVGRVFSRRVVPIEDGQFAIEAELEVFDEAYAFPGKGMSVAVMATRVREPLGGKGTPDVILLVEERTFGSLETYDALTSSLLPDLTVHTREVRRKGLEQVAILVIRFTAESVAAAFIGQGATWAMKRLRASLLDRESAVSSRVAYHLQFRMATGYGEVEVLLEVPPGAMRGVQQPTVDLEDAKRFVQRTVGDSDLRLVVLRFSPNAPHWSIKYFIDAEDKVITL